MSRELTLAGYAVIAAAMLACEVAAHVSPRFARLGDVVAVLARTRAGRAVLLAGWMWLGWHVFVRSAHA